MKASTTIIRQLNAVLKNELIAINQSFLHSRMFRNWGMGRIGEREYKKSINDMKQAMEGMLAPKYKELIIGRAEIREVFTIPKVGTIAGCHVLSGKMERNLEARLIRDSVVVYQGKIASIRRFKDDVKEVAAGYDCGLSIEKFQDLKQGDVVEPFVLEEITS